MRPEVIRGLHNVKPHHRGCVATIGAFDGVHAGHRAIITQLARDAAALDLPTTLVTFEPLPREFFSPGEGPGRLTRLRDKLLALGELPLDRVVILRFDARLAALEAEAFTQQVLVEALGVKRLVTGNDFRFGRGRRGDFALLERMGREDGFEAVRIAPWPEEGARISSTAIREALASGEMDRAARLLGRPYTISGRVAEGDRLGRTLGFPTANIPLGRRPMAVRGVYAVRVRDEAGAVRNGVANIGHRPTVRHGPARLEAHVFDFEGDLYGRRLCVELVHRLRDAQRFPSLDALRAQIASDAAAARALFAAGVGIRGAGK